MTTATAAKVELDREFVDEFLLELAALAHFDEIRAGRIDTWFADHIYGMRATLERAAGVGPMDDEEAEAGYARESARGDELFQTFLQAIGEGRTRYTKAELDAAELRPLAEVIVDVGRLGRRIAELEAQRGGGGDAG